MRTKYHWEMCSNPSVYHIHFGDHNVSEHILIRKSLQKPDYFLFDFIFDSASQITYTISLLGS